MEHILSLSYGKDSMACLGAIERLGWPLDRIVTADVWATDDIPADLPPMVEFKARADAIIKERWGITVEHVRGKYTAETLMYRRRVKGNHAGQIMGWPMTKGQRMGCELQRPCKVKPLQEIQRGGIIYLGIAADEPSRIAGHIGRPHVKLPLVELGWQEDYCGLWSKYSGLLAPTYTDEVRGGCWFCPNQRVDSLRRLRRNYPGYWALMLGWDEDSQFPFKPKRTLRDYDRRFQAEDEGRIIPEGKRFRWGEVTP